MRHVRAFLCCLVLAAPVFAQNDRGTITGTILDQAGAAVPNATVTATNVETGTGSKTSSTGTGNYTIPSLPAGRYTLSLEVSGFKKFVQENIEVQVAGTNRIDVALQVGSTSETITITAEAALLKTETAEQSTIITGERINQLPLNFGGGGGSTGSIRSPYLFNILSPGVADNSVGQGDTANVNGLPASTFRVQVDGQDATSQNDTGWTSTVAAPSVDMIQEFSLQTSNYAAEFGQAAGGLYNFTMKSGGNALHGSGYEYFTNEDLDAYRPFTYVNPRSRKNDFGGTIGGPVVIPKIYNGRNKTFFFFNEEIYRNTVNTAGSFLTMPTAQMRAGDFSQILTGKSLGADPLGRPILENTIYNPYTARSVNGQLVTDPFAGNIIPPSLIDPVSAKIQALIPTPTGPGLTLNWAQNTGNYKRQQTPAFKIDHTLPDSSKLSFYFSKQLTNQLTSPDGLPAAITAVRVQAIFGTTVRLNYDRSITPTLLLHLGVGYQRFHNPDSSPDSVLKFDAAGQLGFTGSATSPGGFPRINWSAAVPLSAGTTTNFGPSNANSYFDGVLPANAAVTYVRGNHTYKLGAEFHLSSWTDRNTRGSQGILNFQDNETGLPYLGTANVGGSTVGFPYASFLLGLADTGSVNAIQDPQLRKKSYSLYIQDTWKITRKLTLDYGLRWDLESEGHEIHYRTSMFGPTVPNPAVNNLPGALVFEGFGPGRCNCQFTRTYPFALGPRLGVAYQLDQKTVFRGGFGVSYGAVPTFNYITNGALLGVGFNQLNFTSPSFGTAAVTLKNGLQYSPGALYDASLNPGLVPTPGQLNSPNYYLDPNGARPPRILQWSAGVQREITRDLILEASYVGNRGAWENANSLDNLDAINPATLAAKGLDPATASGQALLTSTFASGKPQAAGFSLPYPTFPASATLAQALRPFPQFNGITVNWAPLGDSWYNSLQAKLTKRYSKGLTIISAFTWSKTEANPGGTVNNIFNRANQKSITSFDQPLILNTGFSYELQKYGENWALKHVVAGWTVGGLFAYSSGLPIATPTATGNQNSVLFQNTLMNRVAGQPLFLKDLNCHCIDPNKDFALNPAAWANPAPGAWGTAAPYYNDFRFQRRPVEQMNLGRTFRIKEKRSLEIRAEFFNIFNRTYLSNPSLTAPTSPQSRNAAGVPASGWGYINPTSLQTQPRNGQLVARFSF
jgi:hypothetical protein